VQLVPPCGRLLGTSGSGEAKYPHKHVSQESISYTELTSSSILEREL